MRPQCLAWKKYPWTGAWQAAAIGQDQTQLTNTTAHTENYRILKAGIGFDKIRLHLATPKRKVYVEAFHLPAQCRPVNKYFGQSHFGRPAGTY